MVEVMDNFFINSPFEDEGLFFQIRFEHATKDESFKLTSIDYRAIEGSDEVWEEADD